MINGLVHEDTHCTLYAGDALDVLRQLPDQSVQTVVTSPPYFGLRDYGLPGQLGLEPNPDEYVANLVAVFAEVRRVLRDDGTCWLNLGSSYISGTIESQEYVLRDDLSQDELAYVYAELAKHFGAESEALSEMRISDAPAEPDVSNLLPSSKGTASKLRDEGV